MKTTTRTSKQSRQRSRSKRSTFIGLWFCILLTLPGCGGCGNPKRVVLYCAQDKEFAEQALNDFTKQAGLAVLPKFDTEKGKSVELYIELISEKDRPRCDVFWNNEILSTIRLQQKGLLEPYASPSAEPYPAWAKAKDQTWHAFAERARVLIVNTQLVPEADRPRSLFDLANKRWQRPTAMSKPQAGTSATQAACLFEVLGTDAAKAYYRDLRKNSVNIVDGNKQVAESVGSGQFAVGITDTDDAIEEVKKGRPVAIIFPDRDGDKDRPRMGTLFIPNTVAIIKGGPNPNGARKLVDFLLSPEIEKALAEAESHQIPLNPQVTAQLPPQIETPKTVKRMDVDFDKAADLWDEVQTFLNNKFARP